MDNRIDDRDRLEFLEQLGRMSKVELWALLAVINFMIFRNRLRAMFPTTAARLLLAGLVMGLLSLALAAVTP